MHVLPQLQMHHRHQLFQRWGGAKGHCRAWGQVGMSMTSLLALKNTVYSERKQQPQEKGSC